VTIPSSGFDADVSALDAHRQHLGAVMDQLGDALRVALETSLPAAAFGPFGAPLAAAITPTAEVAQTAFEDAVASVGAAQEGMALTVRDYDETERVNAVRLRTAREAE
jgi:hypothetical protein